MRLVRFDAGAGPAWGLLDEASQEVRQIAGGFRAWAPRIANGEGAHALPCTGRRHALAGVALLAPVERDARIRRLDGAEAEARVEGVLRSDAAAGLLVAAIVGAPLVGRRNPLRSLFGYAVAAWEGPSQGGLRLGPVIATREEFGDGAPDLRRLWARCGAAPETTPELLTGLTVGLPELDAASPLRAGDVIVAPLEAADSAAQALAAAAGR